MKADEFRMFIHGPFATNIYIDAQDVQKLKDIIAQERLTLVELNILRSLIKQEKTKDELIKELRQDTKITSSDVLSALGNLRQKSPKYVQKTPKPLRKSTGRQRQRTGVEGQRTAAAPKSIQERKSSSMNFLGGVSRLQEGISSGTDFLKKPSEDLFSITQEGKDKFDVDMEYQKTQEDDPDSEVHIAKEKYYLNRPAIEQFWLEVNAERSISSYKLDKDQLSLDPEEQLPLTQEESFFTDEDRPGLLAIFTFPDFLEEISVGKSVIHPIVDLEFKKNAIYIYPTGVGIFSSEVIVRYSGDDVNKIKLKLEREVNKKLWKYFKDQGAKLKLNKLNDSIRHAARFKLVDIDYFRLELAKVARPAWTHTIYWFYGDNFFQDDKEEGTQTLTDDYRRDFTDLLGQSPENMVFLQNRLVFYGWGRSLILTEKPDNRIKDWVRSRVKLAEVGQYSAFGYILLQYLLQRVLRKLTSDEPIVVRSDRDLKKEIERIDNIRLAVLVFLEEFRSGIGTILLAAAPYLTKTLESQWRLDKVEENIRNRLESLNNERSAREQSLITQKQDRMNIISSTFTIMGIAAVTAAMVALYPLDEMFRPGENGAPPQLNEMFRPGENDPRLVNEELDFSPFVPPWDELDFFIIATLFIIGLAIVIMFKWHDIKHLFYSKISSWKYVYDSKHDIRDICLKLAQEEYKQEVYSEVGALRRKIKDSFDKGKINRSQFEKLMNEFERQEIRRRI